MRSAMILFVALIAIAAPCTAAELTIDRDFPVVGENATITLSGDSAADGLELRVVYSPNSETQSVEVIGELSAAGEIVWQPSRPGIATLSVVDGDGDAITTENVAVLFDGTPTTGVLVMFFAGVLLFGGAAVSLRTVLASGVPDHDAPLDT